jgi:iron complex transport system ATP-binding protein
MKNAIECSNLAIGYKDNNNKENILIPDFSIGLRTSELTALVGPNGAGKTTLLKTISKNLSPISGEIFLQGKNLKNYNSVELAKKISIVLTDRIIDNHIKVYDVVATGRYPYTGFWATLNSNDRSVINNSLEMVGVESFAKRTFNSLSDGERQKVMIAKALAQNTPVILLDEPSAFLDYPSKIELIHLLQNLVKNFNITILFSSHDLELVLRTADRLWLVASGKPIVSDIPEQLVLDGVIDQYFSRAGMFFDSLKGQFVQPGFENRRISILADGLTGVWLHNALERKGWQVNQGLNEPVTIQFVNNEFTLTNHKMTTRFNKLENLLIEIDHYEDN